MVNSAEGSGGNSLGDYLRARRELVSPTTVGLPEDQRRRVPGLRREEVAVLAGVSTEWYARLEKGHISEVSEEVLDAVARALQLDDEERTTGMRCVAAPILNVHGEAVAGISVSGPTHRLPDAEIRRIGELVRDGALKVSRRLGAA
jgi:DNA-binding IclR family transcriptional regulator